MDLFEIERYDETALQANHTEEQLLLDFQNRIKERKKKMASDLTQKSRETADKNSQNDDHVISRRKRKKLKSKNLMRSSVVSVTDDAHRVARVLEEPGSANAEENPMTARVKKKKKVARVSRIVEASPEDAYSPDIKDSSKEDSPSNKDFPNKSDSRDDNQELVPSAPLGINSPEHALSADVVGSNKEPVGESERSFPILGRQKRPKKGPAKSLLPRWLSDHIVVSASLASDKRPVEDIGYLQRNSINNLRKAGISHLFPIQSSVIPYLLAQTVGSSIHAKAGLLPNDICVQAPTGSGKTISYVIPIVEILSRASVRHLYALVVLPSKDLAIQVKKVFDLFTQGTRLKVALVSGVNSFAKEQEKLVVKCLDRYLSKVDIIVCTPGRLVDHMKQTAGFSLTKLRFLVLDEADRLLSETYNNWLEEILRRAYETEESSILSRKSRPASSAESMMTSYSPLQKLLFSATLTKSPEKLASLCLYQPVLFACRSVPEREHDGQFQAGVCDSTTTNSSISKNNNDDDIGSKNNNNNSNNNNINNNNDDSHGNPICRNGDADNGHGCNVNKVEDEESLRYILPSGLRQRMIIVEAGEKPLVVLHLLASLKHTGVLCFTKSIEATHRLYLLLSEFKSIRSAEFSSSLSEVQRKGIIRDFRAGLIDVVVSSDAMARGMDLNNVSVVLNYDTATNVKTYVHRVGRTARAGAEGVALTILTFKEVYHFKQMTAKLSSKDKPTKLRVTSDDLSVFVADYEKALDKLKTSVAAEKKKERSGARSFRAGSSVKRTRV